MKINMYSVSTVSALIALLLSVSVPGKADIVLNGGYESPSIPGLLGAPNVAIADSVVNPTDITNWTVSTGDVTLVNPGIVGALGLFGAQAGSQYVVLNGLSIIGGTSLQVGNTGTFQQQVNLTPGANYQVSFYYQGLSVSALNGTAELQVNVSNASNSTAPNGGLVNVTAQVNSWTPETFTFTATGSTSTLAFGEPNGSLANADGVALDDVSITPVPEPSQSTGIALAFIGAVMAVRAAHNRRQA